MAREGLIDDSGYNGFEECSRYEDCQEQMYEEIRNQVYEEITDMIRLRFSTYNDIVHEILRRIEEMQKGGTE